MVVIQKVLGSLTILSTLRAFPAWGQAGVATNVVRIRKLGLTLYLLQEQYELHPNGSDLLVHSKERIGPIPFLFRSTKRHPARIDAQGWHATYLDMPLLGTLWTGHYQVLEDEDHIDAKLTCRWASTSEVIARFGTRSDDRWFRKLRETAPSPTTDLSCIIERLQNYRDWYDTVHDSRAIFTHAYLTITRIFDQQIPKKAFDDPNWVVALDIAFAEHYFQALDAFDLGEEVPAGWRPVFVAIQGGRTSVLEELVLCMAAHIVHDLPLALHTVGRTQGERSCVRDFHLANDILELGINKIQAEVTWRYNPVLRWLDSLSGQEDEILTNYGIRLARAVAWFNAERLANPTSRGEALASIARSSAIVVQRLLRPSLLSFTVVLRLVRLFSRLTRVWPGSDVWSTSARRALPESG